jgi:hypothetical protein
MQTPQRGIPTILIVSAEGMSVNPGEIMNEIDDHEIEERDIAAKKQHRDNDHDCGIGQLLVTPDPLVLGFPGPRRFLQLGANFAEKVSRFRDHGNI